MAFHGLARHYKTNSMQQLQQTLTALNFHAREDFMERMYNGIKNDTYKQKDLITWEGRKMDYFLLVRSGKIKCSCLNEDQEAALSFAQSNEIIAFPQYLHDSIRHTVRIEAIDDCEISSLSMHQWEMLETTAAQKNQRP